MRARALAAVAVTVLALLATSCGTGGTTPGGTTDKAITINGCNPENPLVGALTSEVCGGDILDIFTTKLVSYNSDTAKPELDIAESIDTEDNQNFTVKLKAGYKFHDGTEVKAKNFVDAWNWAADGKNGTAGAYFMKMIEGWDAVQCGNGADGKPDCAGSAPKADTMSGLAVVDERTFTIKTTEKVSNLLVRLGYSAFVPMPDSFFADPKAHEAKPIGSGPFKFVSRSETEIVVEKFAEFSGAQPVEIDKITFKIYPDGSTAGYTDVVSNALDILDGVPEDQLVGERYKTDLDGRSAQLETGGFRWIGFSPVDEQLKDNVDLRKSFSMAIDRQAIAAQVMNGSSVPAAGWVSPAVDGYAEGACGEACVFDAAKAKALYDKAGGYEGELTYTTNTAELATNAKVGEAICNQLKNNLGVNCKLVSTGEFAAYNKALRAREVKGIFRAGWQMDYPSIENFLAPIYTKGASSNFYDYGNEKFIDLLTQAAAADAGEPSNKLYQEAEKVLAADFPTAPLVFARTTIGWSDRLQPVKITPFGRPDLVSVKLK